MSSTLISGRAQCRGSRPPRGRVSLTSSDQVRRKFFQKLGIGEGTSPGSIPRSQNVSVSRPSSRDVRLMPRFQEPLRYDRQEEREQEERLHSRQSSSPTSVDARELTSAEEGARKPKKGVRFQETVTVVRIPTRSEYSDRIRARLFSDAEEMCANAERNLAEFTAENGDWRSVTLEEEMYICAITGELIHPVHVETNKYVFGSAAGCQQSLSQERAKYWNDEVAI